MENPGLLPDPRPIELKLGDRVMGASPTPKEERGDGNWKNYFPDGEAQSVPGVFDTSACVTYGVGHAIESHIIWLILNNKLSKYTLDFLKDSGYFTDPNDANSFRISKRYTAIMSGTTKLGNYVQKVCDTFRHLGALPEKDFPFGGNSFEEYHDKSLITPDMKKKAIDFLNHFIVEYEWVQGYDSTGGFSTLEYALSKEALKYSPLVIGIPIQANHVILMGELELEKYFALDHYKPFLRTNDAKKIPVNFAMRISVTPIFPAFKESEKQQSAFQKLLALLKKK